jgi:hypothetical protein
LEKANAERSTSYLLSLVEFMEKASTNLSGFKNDINSVLVEENIPDLILRVSELYKSSDIMN